MVDLSHFSHRFLGLFTRPGQCCNQVVDSATLADPDGQLFSLMQAIQSS